MKTPACKTCEDKPALPFTITQAWHAGREGYELVTVTAIADGGIFVGEKEYWTNSKTWGRRRLRASCLFPQNRENDAIIYQLKARRMKIDELMRQAAEIQRKMIPYGGDK